MHQIHRRVRLQQVPPHPLARIRFARHQQNPQPVAHAVDLHHRHIVAVGQLPGLPGNRQLQHVDPGMGQFNRQVEILPDRHAEGRGRIGIQRNCHIDTRPRRRRSLALILDPELEAGLFPHDRKGRRIGDHQPPVPIGLLSGQQHLQRRRQFRDRRHVMDLPVGDHDRPGNPRLWHLCQRPCQSRHRQCPGIVLAIGHMHDPKFGIGDRRNLGLDRLHRLRGLERPVRQALRRAVIHHQHHDIRQRLALFLLQGRIAQGHQHKSQRKRPDRPADQPAPQRQSQQQRRREPQGNQSPIRHQGLKDQRLAHLPSLSSRAGTWT